LAVRAAGATNIILLEAIGIGQSISRRAWDFSRSAAARRDSIRSAEFAHFSRLSPRLSAVTALLQATEKERKAEHDLTLETAIEYKTQWEDELERRTALGIVGPDPIPHPDDVIINVKTGEVHITGPVTKQEKVKWDRLRSQARMSRGNTRTERTAERDAGRQIHSIRNRI
jgi:hypothetical protein